MVFEVTSLPLLAIPIPKIRPRERKWATARINSDLRRATAADGEPIKAWGTLQIDTYIATLLS